MPILRSLPHASRDVSMPLCVSNLYTAVMLCLMTLSQGISTSDMDFGGRTATTNRQKLIQSGGKCGQDKSLIVNWVQPESPTRKEGMVSSVDMLQGCFLGIG
ncbi:hypothetical protein VFPPC_17519 [Pochonia chlamydosporia 170]|uniref:Uncharacterized protein n=1 Tax=Pochonia chlamydosporia 170 TaxID=1380566 RepID=A0A219ARA7_METCM|nr:hypothetical protein VFPPC_17519 [Pochonia chlamydosporia 170]OWT43318.1 hypothetical protein VFPPC_17519 [Pochonia chlamydosporia 170]